MRKFTLEIFLQIIGIGAASGLVFNNGQLLVIADNSTYLYEYFLDTNFLKRHPLSENPSENITKIYKPDFESIIHYGNKTYIFGSGATENRNLMIQLNAQTNKIETITDLSNLYLSMQSFANLPEGDLNIEGVAFTGNEWYFLNRGNGRDGKNIVFTVQGKNLTEEFNIISNAFKLPKINGVASSFTDAVLVNDSLYFLAAAENTNSTFEDGAISGSLIGRINLKKMRIDFTKKISDTHKFEGFSLYEETEKTITFLLCDDNDTSDRKTTVFKLVMHK